MGEAQFERVGPTERADGRVLCGAKPGSCDGCGGGIVQRKGVNRIRLPGEPHPKGIPTVGPVAPAQGRVPWMPSPCTSSPSPRSRSSVRRTSGIMPSAFGPTVKSKGAFRCLRTGQPARRSACTLRTTCLRRGRPTGQGLGCFPACARSRDRWHRTDAPACKNPCVSNGPCRPSRRRLRPDSVSRPSNTCACQSLRSMLRANSVNGRKTGP